MLFSPKQIKKNEIERDLEKFQLNIQTKQQQKQEKL